MPTVDWLSDKLVLWVSFAFYYGVKASPLPPAPLDAGSCWPVDCWNGSLFILKIVILETPQKNYRISCRHPKWLIGGNFSPPSSQTLLPLETIVFNYNVKHLRALPVIQVWSPRCPIGCPWGPQDHQNAAPGTQMHPQDIKMTNYSIRVGGMRRQPGKFVRMRKTKKARSGSLCKRN